MSMCNILFIYIYLYYLLNQRWELGCYMTRVSLLRTTTPFLHEVSLFPLVAVDPDV